MVSARQLLVLAVAAIVALAGYEILTIQEQQAPFNGVAPTSFTVNGNTYTFTYAATDQAEWSAGLMNREITNSTTMLFAFSAFRQWSFWMYDTNTSLDIIWLNATGSTAHVVYLVTGASPCHNSSTCTIYTPPSPANYAIEAKSGFAGSNGISVGTIVHFG